MPIEEGRPCSCCGCAAYWLDVSFASTSFDQSQIDSGAQQPQAMSAGSSRQATVYDAGTAHVQFVGTPSSPAALIAADPPAEYSATETAFAVSAELTAATTLFFSGTADIFPNQPDWLPRPFPYLFSPFSGEPYWLNVDPQYPPLASSWEVLKDQKYGPILDSLWSFNLTTDSSLVARLGNAVPEKGWLVNANIASGGESRRFMPSSTSASSLHCVAWKWQNGSAGLVTFAPGIIDTKTSTPVASLSASAGRAGISHLQWGNQFRIGPSGILYVRVRVLQNARPKAGKSFTVTATGGGSATATVSFVAQDGYVWQNNWTPPAVAPWDGTTPIAIQAVDINEASEYAVFAIKGTPARTVSVGFSFGTATTLDVSSVRQALSPSDWSISSYSRFPPAIQGGSVSIYKADALVHQAAANPPANETGDAAYLRQWSSVGSVTAEGVYLVVAEKTGTFQTYFKEFASFVIDKTSPLAGSTAPGDIFAGESIPTPQVYMSEPNGVVPTSPVFMKLAGEQSGDFRRIAPSGVGTYTVVPVNSSDRTGFFSDRAGNVSPYLPRFNFRIVAVPANGLRGARPTLTLVPAIRPYALRARRTDERVESVLLKFDRKVTAATLAQCTLYRTTIDNSDAPITEEVSGLSFSPVTGYDGLRWTIGIPAGDQTPRSFFVLEYDPAGTYTADTNNPEECLLTARVSWMIAGSDEPDNAIDVSWYDTIISGQPTVTSPYSFEADDNIVRLEAGSAGDGMAGLGVYRYPKGVFTPAVPPQTSPPADCSWFGLTTTIDPCPPKTLTLCKSPRVSQTHSSLLRCNSTITGWIITPPQIADSELDFDGSFPGYTGSFSQLIQKKIATKLLGGPVEVSESIDGDPIPQNSWHEWKEVDEEVDPQNHGYSAFQFSSSFSQLPLDINIRSYAVKASVSVSRQARTYPVLETTTLSESNVNIRVQVFAIETISREEEIDPETNEVAVPELPPRVYKQVYSLDGSLILTKQQEESLAGGAPLTLAMSDLGGWTLAAVSGG